MKFAISLLSLRPGLVGGSETYVRELVRHLPGVAGPDQLVAVLDKDLARSLETPGFERAVLDVGATELVLQRSAEALSPYRARAAERAFGGLGADAILFPQQSVFPKAVTAPAVLTVVDVQHLMVPGNVRLADRIFRAGAYGRSLRRADRIIAISEFTRRTLIEVCTVPAEKVVTVPLGAPVRETEAVEPMRRPGGPYLYYPAASYAHKNHLALLRAMATLRREGKLGVTLVLTGQRTAYFGRIEREIRRLGLGNAVEHLGFVTPAEVRRVFAGAHTVVFPSRFEGFGLPIVEAVSLGKRVVTSRLPVFDEIGVPRRNQIDFEDPAQLRDALALPEPTVLEKAPTTWAETAAATLDVMRTTALQSR